MAASLFFYDLETSGINPRESRIMQFAGQRTDLQLKPIGEPVNLIVRLSDEVLPDPDAILITGITPQQTQAEGLTEAEFLKIFTADVATPDTIFVGFNSVRFDDEFMRFIHYRNFYDAYAWQWQDGRGRWDILDLVRMTRALRPEGIKWPYDSKGKPSNRLELLTSLNGLEHTDAHDALSDVYATIAVARLIRNKQTKLFDYSLSVRGKRKVAELVDTSQPFVYTSGKYPAEFEKTTVVVKVANHPTKQGALVFDLRHDPAEYLDKTPAELAELWKWKRDDPTARLPVKTLQFNRCPAIAPMGVLDEGSRQRLQLDLKLLETHHKTLAHAQHFVQNLLAAVELLNKDQQTRLLASPTEVDGQLYDGFIAKTDGVTMSAVRVAEPQELATFADSLHDARLKALLPLYKARNYPKALDAEERVEWEAYRQTRLLDGGAHSRLQRYFVRIQELAANPRLSQQKQYLLEELRLYGETIMPDPDFAG